MGLEPTSTQVSATTACSRSMAFPTSRRVVRQLFIIIHQPTFMKETTLWQLFRPSSSTSRPTL